MGWGFELIWLRIGTSGGLLWIRCWPFGFREMLGSSWVAARLLAPQEGLSSLSKWARSIMRKPFKKIVVARNCLNLILYGLGTNVGAISTDEFQIVQNSCPWSTCVLVTPISHIYSNWNYPCLNLYKKQYFRNFSQMWWKRKSAQFLPSLLQHRNYAFLFVKLTYVLIRIRTIHNDIDWEQADKIFWNFTY
jgi:hypothetical protein